MNRLHFGVIVVVGWFDDTLIKPVRSGLTIYSLALEMCVRTLRTRECYAMHRVTMFFFLFLAFRLHAHKQFVILYVTPTNIAL